MRVLDGIGVCPGTVVGPALRMADPPPKPSAQQCMDPLAEEQRIAPAMAAVAGVLESMADAASGELADVLSATALIANDPVLLVEAKGLIERTEVTAERAVWEAFERYRDMLAAAGGYLAARLTDLDDVRNRIVAELSGVAPPGIPDPGHPYVLVARDLAPADTAGLRPDLVLGFVTEGGGPTSHTAILAKALGTPAVVACTGALQIQPGDTVVIDGGTGRVVVDPDDAHLAQAANRVASRLTVRALDRDAGRTADGQEVLLVANVGDPGAARAAAEAGAQGVGLFRTEFCFLDHDRPPTIDAQRQAYGEVFAAFPGRKVVVRTLDAGADKPLAFVSDGSEPNPALGVRGIRFMRTAREILVDQLTAIARAAADNDADVRVMAPMVSTPEETAEFVAVAREVGIASAGVMIEVPAAALLADEIFAAGADFASIGTNDLTQYTYAADRLLAPLATLNDHWQPAVIRLADRICRAGEAAGVPVSVCGESAADPVYAAVLVGLGVRCLSMTPRSLPIVDALLRLLPVARCREVAAVALAAPRAAAARDNVRALLPELDDLGL